MVLPPNSHLPSPHRFEPERPQPENPDRGLSGMSNLNFHVPRKHLPVPQKSGPIILRPWSCRERYAFSSPAPCEDGMQWPLRPDRDFSSPIPERQPPPSNPASHSPRRDKIQELSQEHSSRRHSRGKSARWILQEEERPGASMTSFFQQGTRLRFQQHRPALPGRRRDSPHGSPRSRHIAVREVWMHPPRLFISESRASSAFSMRQASRSTRNSSPLSGRNPAEEHFSR